MKVIGLSSFWVVFLKKKRRHAILRYPVKSYPKKKRNNFVPVLSFPPLLFHFSRVSLPLLVLFPPPSPPSPFSSANQVKGEDDICREPGYISILRLQ